MIAVLDSGVVVAGIFWRNEPYRCLVALAQRRFVLAASDSILDEYECSTWEVKAKQRIPENPRPWLDYVRRRARRIEPIALARPVCRDPKDDQFVECALAAGAQFVVSRDKDLLALEKPFGIEIVTPRHFLSVLAAQRKTSRGKN